MTPKGINTGDLGETIGETKVHLEGALRNGHNNITVSFLNTPPLRHVPIVKIIRSVQRSEVQVKVRPALQPKPRGCD